MENSTSTSSEKSCLLLPSQKKLRKLYRGGCSCQQPRPAGRAVPRRFLECGAVPRRCPLAWAGEPITSPDQTAYSAPRVKCEDY
uniref:Uncharacterized protein n=1 Tax=Ficus carica TaxID=3494 RepID=A0AA88EJW6_FICCA|nr:hypothetical protein TIFTF001_055849 [Ficus carica]